MSFVRKGDMVTVLAGKDKGKQGKVLRVFPREQKLIVEHINFVKKHIKPNQQQPQGGIVEREVPIFTSKVMVVCPQCKKRTRIGHKMVGENRARSCKKCGEIIDKI